MEVPKDYVLEIIRTTLDGKIDTIENNLKCEIHNVKNDINSLKTEIISLNTEIKTFNKTCKHDMNEHEKRIRTIEDFRIKIIAVASVVGAISAFIFTLILK